MSKFKNKKTEYEEKLDEFFQIDTEHNGNIGLITNAEYDEVGLDTTIMDPEKLKNLMGNEFAHVINHFKKVEESN